jgi:hypothetical protein|tara:strand:- start:892 stop:1137 length:246 start_codon:yes stop_codon:yes gene_type:complete
MKKLSEKELSTLKEYQEQNAKISVDLGNIEINFSLLKKQKEIVLKEFDSLQESQNSTGKELQEKYGAGNIDLEKGEFTPVE